MMHRHGAGTSVMFFAFVIIMIMVFGGIIWGVSAFYGSGHDFRMVESELLLERTVQCVEELGGPLFFDESFDIYGSCQLHEGVIGDGSHVILVRNIVTGQDVVWGVSDFENQCEFVGGQDNVHFPRCSSVTVFQGDIEYLILAGSNQASRRGAG